MHELTFLKDAKYAFDHIEPTEFLKGDKVESDNQEFIDWLPDKKRNPRPLLGRLFVWLLPQCFKRTEVRFGMLKEEGIQ